MSNVFGEAPEPFASSESGAEPDSRADGGRRDSEAGAAGGAPEAELVAGPAADAEPVGEDGQQAAGPEDDVFKLNVSDDLSSLETLLSDDFARISAERDEFLDALKRLQADFDNYRKRTERQQAELRRRASEALVARLLPVLDALELAMSHLGLGAATPTDEASTALLQVNSLLRDVLGREGLERIDAVGVGFDPTVHEATAVDESQAADGAGTGDEAAGPTVTEVWRSGYRIGDRVIRPAMVRVRG
ncbi:MAG TPA: nucleotide exchange factor GrpE [Acidimicrobiales bacterium]|nr:nucleotide exchange factor GrpE [Acidimicrobiales bacterium]